MDNLSEAVVGFWNDQLQPWPKETVEKLGLSPRDATYLQTIGLPVGVDWSLEIPAFAFERPPSIATGLIPLARDAGVVPICLVIETGEVVAIEESRTRAVNSTLHNFGAFLMFFQDYRRRVRDVGEAESQALIEEVEAKMEHLDPSSMQKEAYWPVVVEQMRDGLL